jgi:TPR repeat protein
MKYIVLIFCLIIAACNPVSTAITTTPAVIIGVYDQMGKRALWLERAEKGDIYAQYELGESLCCNSREGETNILESAKWFCKSAQNGNQNAMMSLARIFEGRKAQSVKVDKTKALGLYMMADWRASLQGSMERKRLQSQLSAEEVANAKNFAYYFDFHDCSKILTE